MKIRKIFPLLMLTICAVSCNSNNNDRTVYLYYGENIVRTVSVKLGDTYTPPENPVKKEAYDFKGWYLNPAFTSFMKVSAPIKVVNDIHLYANYTIKMFSVIYHMIGNNRPVDDIFTSVPYGQKATYLDFTWDTDFIGYYKDEECKTKYNFNQSIFKETIIYGKWTD